MKCTALSRAAAPATNDHRTVAWLTAPMSTYPIRIALTAYYRGVASRPLMGQRSYSGRGGFCSHAAQRREDFAARVRLPEVAGTPDLIGQGPCLRIVERGEVDDRCPYTLFHELAVHVDAGHSSHLDIDEQAIEARTPRVLEELLGGQECDRLEAGLLQQPRHRAAMALVVVDDSDVAARRHCNSCRSQSIQGRLRPIQPLRAVPVARRAAQDPPESRSSSTKRSTASSRPSRG